MNIVEKAIKNNEIKFLLEGTNGYKLENDNWASISAPIDWTRVVPLIYKQYEKSFDANMKSPPPCGDITPMEVVSNSRAEPQS